jgi:hypothetical protein
MAEMIKVSAIKTAEPFKSLLPIKPEDLEGIQAHMAEQGFDPKEALAMWKEKRVLVDGHTRLEAAKNLGITEIPVVWKSFGDEDAAVLYAIHAQRDRRNWGDAEIFRLTVTLDKRKKAGRPNLLASIDANSPKGKSSEQTARLLNTFPKKIENARYLLAYGSEELKSAVLEGKMKIHAATNKAREEIIQNRIIIQRIPINGGKEYTVELSRKKLLQALKKVMTLGWSNTDYQAEPLVFQKDWMGTFQGNNERHMVIHPLATGLEGIIPAAPLIKMLGTLDRDLVRIRITDYGFEMTAEDYRKTKATLKLRFMPENRAKDMAKSLIEQPIAQIKWNPLPKDFLAGVRYCAYSVGAKLPGHKNDNALVIDGIDILSADNNRASWFMMGGSGIDGAFLLPIPAVKALSKFPELTSYSLEPFVCFKNKEGIIFAVQSAVGGMEEAVNRRKRSFAGPWLRTYDFPKETGNPFTKLGIDRYDRILLRSENILHVVNPQQKIVYRKEDEKIGVITTVQLL